MSTKKQMKVKCMVDNVTPVTWSWADYFANSWKERRAHVDEIRKRRWLDMAHPMPKKGAL